MIWNMGDALVVPSQAPADIAPDQYSNQFQLLVPEAISHLRRLMKNSPNEKTIISICENILDRAGATRKAETRVVPKIEIKDSNVQLLITAAKEAFLER